MGEKRRKKNNQDSGGAPAWMVTYGDLMSLLLTFFVLLLSFSTINEEDFREAIMSLRGALGVLPRHTSPVMPFMADAQTSRSRAIERVARDLQRRMQILGYDKLVDVEMDLERGGLTINLPSQVLFATASAEVKPDAYPVLSDVATILGDVPDAFVEIRGHTDSRPLSPTPLFRDNWDLSYHRAKSVMEFLREAGDLPEEDFEAIACGPTQPVATNETEEGRQANRRVELFVRGNFPPEVREDLLDRIERELPVEDNERNALDNAIRIVR